MFIDEYKRACAAYKAMVEYVNTNMGAKGNDYSWIAMVKLSEIAYRKYVLDEMQVIYMTLPKAAAKWPDFYRVFEDFLSTLLDDKREYVSELNEEKLKAYETAHKVLNEVTEAALQTIETADLKKPKSFMNAVENALNGITDVWLAYRNTIVPIKEKNGGKQS